MTARRAKSRARKSAPRSAGPDAGAKGKAGKPAGKKPRAKAAKKPRKASAKSDASRLRRARAWRLPLDVQPSSMDVAFDVAPTRTMKYTGEAGINLQLGRPRRRIELHAADLRVSRVRIRTGGETLKGTAELHPERETVELHFPSTIPAGHARLELAFSGRLRGDLCGLYAARSGEHAYAFSQLAATHARRLMPCFDEPSMKARFRISVTTDATHTVLANMPIESEELLDAGRKCVSFRPTPPLSSYLVAIAIGQLEGSASVMHGNVPIRVWNVPGRAGLSAFALEVARETLGRLEAWFGLPYPYEKLDLVAVPDFEFGAMENPGAVFFREALLLLDPETATLTEKKRAAEVICHELSHMWYGDLVTMAWWDDLWLNEAFATWMAFEIIDQWRPEWRVWQTFQHRRAAALDADALANTHAIYAPVASADEALENFDLITYEKGAAIVRMLQRHLGAETFRDGVRVYIRRHRESNAVAADLWGALAEVSGQSVEGLVRPWLEQSGHPVVTIERRERRGLGVVALAQERMRLAPATPRRPAAAQEKWPIPMLGRVGTGPDGGSRTVRHTLTRRRELIPAQGADLTFLYGNADEGGFYRPNHSAALLRDLIESIAELSASERQGLVDHQWALVRSGRAEMAGLMDLLAVLGDEHDPDVLLAARAPLYSLCKQLIPDAIPDCEPRLRAWVEVYYGAQVDALGWDPAPDEHDDDRIRRATLLDIVGVVGEASSIIAEARTRCESQLKGRGGLDPYLADSVVQIAARNGDAALYDRMHAAMRRANTPQAGHRYLYGLAAFRDRAAIERTLELCHGDEVAMQDVSFLLTRLLENPDAAAPTWAFITKRWARLRKRLPPQLAGRLIAATPALLTREHRSEVAAFFAARSLPGTDRPLRQALERFDAYAAFRRHAAGPLAAYLKGSPD